MQRGLLVAGTVLSGLLCLSVKVANGDPPDLLRSYRFLPRQSTLVQSIGVAGANGRYVVSGRFDLVSGWEYVDDPKPVSIHPFAEFENVRAWATNPLLGSPPLNLDHVLNLSGLRGRQLPVAAPFDVYQFQGNTEDGSAVNLYASLIGRWFYLRGGTEAPSESAGVFEYRINALARQQPFADFNEDGVVDRDDLLNWASHAGPTPAAEGDWHVAGDANADALVDGDDFLLWQQQAGEVAPETAPFDSLLNSALATLPAGSAVPEPGAVGLVGLGAMTLWALRRRK